MGNHMSKPEELRRIRTRPDGRIWWRFTRGDEPHTVKAAACVSKSFRDDVAADAWAAAQAQAVCDRLDYAASVDGLEAAALAELARLIEEIETAEACKAAIKAQFPTLIQVGDS